MIIGLLKEPSFETRTSLLPEHAAALKKMNVELIIESGAGASAYATDDKYVANGATIGTRNEVLQKADLILTINPIEDADQQACNGKVLIGFFQAFSNADLISLIWSSVNFFLKVLRVIRCAIEGLPGRTIALT